MCWYSTRSGFTRKAPFRRCRSMTTRHNGTHLWCEIQVYGRLWDSRRVPRRPHAVMRRCGLQNVKLVRADLTGADLERSALADTDLRDARMVGCKLGASGLLHARPSGVNLSGATGLARALIEEIDIGPEGAPEILTGEAALARLPRCTKLPPE
jgi:uncharacterized protein YjbI with pentapeptide repeats